MNVAGTPPRVSSFVEPTRATYPQNYTLRYGLGLGIVVGGWVVPYALNPLVRDAEWSAFSAFGAICLTVGWLVLPGRLWSRVAAAATGALLYTAYFFLPQWVRNQTPDRPDSSSPAWPVWNDAVDASILVGVVVVVVLATATLAAWLLVRQRPGRSYALLPLAAVLPFLDHYVISNYAYRVPEELQTLLYHVQYLLFPVIGIVVGAWIARHMALELDPATKVRRAEALAPGEPPGFNAMAITSLVLSVLGLTPLGIVFGHVALSQINRTGQGGRRLAIAGLVLGYAYAGVQLMWWIYILRH